MKNHCKANPCCGDPYSCEVPLPQHQSGLPHLNDRTRVQEEAKSAAAPSAALREEVC